MSIFSSSNLYYLQQLGVDPWVKRSVPILITSKDEINSKALSLLENMLKSINLNLKTLRINKDINTLEQKILVLDPQFILILGSIEGIPMHQPCTFHNRPCIATYHPMDLLNKPKYKATAYSDLLKVELNYRNGANGSRLESFI
jgi:hypothetical protein